MKLSELQRGPQSTEGVWVEFRTGKRLSEPTGTSWCLKIGERDNPRYREALASAHMELREDFENDDHDKVMDAVGKASRMAMARSLILDWSGLEDDEGAVLVFSTDLALELLNDEGNWELRNFVTDVSSQRAYYAKEIERATLGN